MKLELKHLAPYLPYELKVKASSDIYKVDGVDISDQTIIAYELEEMWLPMRSCKPILRPLSDLTKLEEGLISEHSINMLIEEKFKMEYGVFSHYKGDLEFQIEGDSSQGYDSAKTISFEVTEFVRNELLKAHYDIFGLIEEGLAIDINTLK